MAAQHTFQAPTGTRDFYPLEMARRRWIQNQWRTVSVRHGFDEIDGPTFEHLDLYTAKSGEGIVSELFSFRRAGGDKDFALRPEFTPTLARMYAAKANALPKPTKWFCVPNFFRAERPQRGRLREFYQWNVDYIGDDSPQADAELIDCCIGFLEHVGLTPEHVKLRVSNRDAIETIITSKCCVSPEHVSDVFALLDKRSKLKPEEFAHKAAELNFDVETFDAITSDVSGAAAQDERFASIWSLIQASHMKDWCIPDFSIVRGLAYYTGTVFEVIADGERAVAGGGRYDNLIELIGGPPTPAVGFAMGDVVLSLLLQDKGLMPTDDVIADQLGLRPDVFVIPSPDVDPQEAITLMSQLRRAGLHTRRSYKSTRNVSKLLKDATNARAKLAVIVESLTTCTLKNLDTNQQQEALPLDQLQSAIHTQLTH